MPNFEATLKYWIEGVTTRQIAQLARGFIDNGSSFAVVDGKLYISKASLDYLAAMNWDGLANATTYELGRE